MSSDIGKALGGKAPGLSCAFAGFVRRVSSLQKADAAQSIVATAL